MARKQKLLALAIIPESHQMPTEIECGRHDMERMAEYYRDQQQYWDFATLPAAQAIGKVLNGVPYTSASPSNAPAATAAGNSGQSAPFAREFSSRQSNPRDLSQILGPRGFGADNRVLSNIDSPPRAIENAEGFKAISSESFGLP